MFDVTLRPLKDDLFNPLARAVPNSITPLHITYSAFAFGLASVGFSTVGYSKLAVLFWALNRALDCLDGAVARHRNQQSDVGGFLDLLFDFTVYSLIPICAAVGSCRDSQGDRGCRNLSSTLLAVALLEAACWLNNFVLFYAAAVAEKVRADGAGGTWNGEEKNVREDTKKAELTSVVMRPALVEGTESAVFFTLMLVCPNWVGLLSSVMTVGVIWGTGQRVLWLQHALREEQKDRST